MKFFLMSFYINFRVSIKPILGEFIDNDYDDLRT